MTEEIQKVERAEPDALKQVTLSLGTLVEVELGVKLQKLYAMEKSMFQAVLL